MWRGPGRAGDATSRGYTVNRAAVCAPRALSPHVALSKESRTCSISAASDATALRVEGLPARACGTGSSLSLSLSFRSIYSIESAGSTCVPVCARPFAARKHESAFANATAACACAPPHLVLDRARVLHLCSIPTRERPSITPESALARSPSHEQPSLDRE